MPLDTRVQVKIINKISLGKITSILFVYFIANFILNLSLNLLKNFEFIFILSQIVHYLNYLNYLVFIIYLYFCRNRFFNETDKPGMQKDENDNKNPEVTAEHMEKSHDRNKKIVKYSAWLIIGLLCVSAFIGINLLIGSLNDSFSNESLKSFLTSLMLDFYVLMSLAVFTLYKTKSKLFLLLLLAGLAVNFSGLVWSIPQIWGAFDSEWTLKVFFILMIISFGIAHTSLILHIKSKDFIIKTLVVITIFLIVINAIYFISLIILEFDDQDSQFTMLAVLSILVLLGSIVTPIINKVNSR
jgi:uncharacterized membrane protein YqjE